MEVIDYTRRREEIVPLLPHMFELISGNMRAIAPTGNTLEEDRAIWTKAMRDGLRDPEKHWIFAFDGESLEGYTLYQIQGDVLRMNEIQIAPAYQGDGETFPLLMGKMLSDARAAEVTTIYAGANKPNLKSQGILRAMGLTELIGETERSFRYKGRAEDAFAWYDGRYGA